MIILKHSAPYRDRTRSGQPDLPSRILTLQDFCRIAAPCELCLSLSFTQQDTISALAVYYLQVSTLNTSRAFGCGYFLSPNHAGGKSFIHIIAILYTYVRPQDTSSRSFGCENYVSLGSPRGESLVHYATYNLSCTYHRLAVKLISHRAVRIGNHSFIMPNSIYRTRTRQSEILICTTPQTRDRY